MYKAEKSKICNWQAGDREEQLCSNIRIDSPKTQEEPMFQFKSEGQKN